MTLARFTPSVLDGETLEQLFVHRHQLLDDVMAAVRDAAGSTERRHKLFVGPRGAGKTHLVSLINHRMQKARTDGMRVGLSWLVEDPWEIETYDDLLAQILEHASEDELTGEAGVLALVAEQGPLVVLVENLDQVLEQIGADGQRRLRALLENERPLLLIATSTRLSQDLASQAEPFYGFFDVTQLEPFSVGQAADMLRHVAEYSHDDSLGALLASPHANARLATIAHLAGGQPRVWALLGTGLTDTGIDDMVDMLLARFDDLTPYYQEQLARLSASERKAVRRLADADRPLTVRDLAELAKTDQRSMSKTVSDLRKRGWVRRHDSILTRNLDSRLSYYELAEPLARIAFQMKAARGEPIRLLVDFLSTWFEREELLASTDSGLESAYRRAAQSKAGLMRTLVSVFGDREAIPNVKVRPPAMLAEIDAALSSLEGTGDVTRIMLLPSAVSSLLATRLGAASVTSLRLLVCEFAIMHRAPGQWGRILDDLIGRLEGHERARALAAQAVSDVESPVALSVLLDQIDNLMTGLPVVRVNEIYAWMTVAFVTTRWNTPDFYLDLARRAVVNQPANAIVRLSLRYIGALESVKCGDVDRALTVARDDYNSAKVLGDDAISRTTAFALASILVESKTRGPEALSLLDEAAFDKDAPSETIAKLRIQAEELIAQLSDADGVPDGLGLGEGAQPGESGVVGP